MDWRLVLVEEGFEDFEVLFRFFVGGEVAALFKEDDLRAGDGVSYAPGGEWSDIHVVAAVEDKGGEVEGGELGREVEIANGL